MYFGSKFCPKTDPADIGTIWRIELGNFGLIVGLISIRSDIIIFQNVYLNKPHYFLRFQFFLSKYLELQVSRWHDFIYREIKLGSLRYNLLKMTEIVVNSSQVALVWVSQL